MAQESFLGSQAWGGGGFHRGGKKCLENVHLTRKGILPLIFETPGGNVFFVAGTLGWGVILCLLCIILMHVLFALLLLILLVPLGRGTVFNYQKLVLAGAQLRR